MELELLKIYFYKELQKNILPNENEKSGSYLASDQTGGVLGPLRATDFRISCMSSNLPMCLQLQDQGPRKEGTKIIEV